MAGIRPGRYMLVSPIGRIIVTQVSSVLHFRVKSFFHQGIRTAQHAGARMIALKSQEPRGRARRGARGRARRGACGRAPQAPAMDVVSTPSLISHVFAHMSVEADGVKVDIGTRAVATMSTPRSRREFRQRAAPILDGFQAPCGPRLGLQGLWLRVARPPRGARQADTARSVAYVRMRKRMCGPRSAIVKSRASIHGLLR